jgi:hypothetical protein
MVANSGNVDAEFGIRVKHEGSGSGWFERSIVRAGRRAVDGFVRNERGTGLLMVVGAIVGKRMGRWEDLVLGERQSHRARWRVGSY